ncbi:MAG TPA: NAD(P)H-hydrate dehydratase [Rhodocyclaceae bacterium]|nr:NAD(P)H-hydrate dehydratase [Rhodocyclaceae bacterium]
MSTQPILTVEGIRAVEAREAPVAQPSLMERAGLAAAEQALGLLSDRTGCVLVVTGSGNNGGDGFVVARHLKAAGCGVVVACAANCDRLPPQASAAHQRWLEAGGSVVDNFVGGQWTLVIDALLGIGVHRPLEGRYAEWVSRLNQLNCPILALDVPSGLNADTGSVLGCAVRASHTATFIALKPGMLTLDGPMHCGQISVHTLGLDIGDVASGQVGEQISRTSFAEYIRPRTSNSHKGDYGEVGIIGGASGMLGAPLLAARAALKLGAGKVYVGLLDPHAPLLDLAQPELMLRPPGDIHLLASALAIGPGLGTSESAQQQLRRALGFAGPLVLDADALNLIAAHPPLQSLTAQREASTVLTPHPAEAARLLQCSVIQIQAHRLDSALELARRLRAGVVLKGNGSIVAAPSGQWHINTSGNPGLASAGTGDALTGLLVSLLAQGWLAHQALCCAVHLHGAAADHLATHGIGPIGLTAGELPDAARAVFNRWILDQGQGENIDMPPSFSKRS